MFDFVRKHTRLMQFMLLVLIVPAFVFFGVEGYRGMGSSGETVAKVAGRAVTQGEWDSAHRNMAERLRSQQPDIDVSLLDSPEMKRQSLESLVRERVMLVASEELHLTTTDERLQRLFAVDPQFAFLRTPEGALNKEVLIARGLSPQQFEQQLRQDIAMRQVLLGIGGTTPALARVADVALDALLQQREVSLARFESKNYVDKVKPSEADLEVYYKDPKLSAAFEAPERASIEYVVLDLEALKPGITVTEEESRQFYEQNASRYGTPDERRASHILVKADKAAPAPEREKARAKAEGLLAEVRKSPARFAELAQKNSDDPGSAVKGGDLDFFGRGAMVKPFEDAVFALKAGDISSVVESDFGFHIIQLVALRGGEKKPFEAVKAEIENEIRQQQAQRKFAEAAETFTNTVYEQSDSLKPVADKLKLTVKTASAVTRSVQQGAQGPLANAKFLTAIFSDDAVRNKRNTEAVEIAPNQLASARVTNHAPARKLPLEEVKDQVRLRVVAAQAAALARKEGEARLAAWRGGAPAEGLEPPMKISRGQTQTYPSELIDAVMKASPAPLPAWTSVDFGDQGFAVLRIDKVLPRDPAGGDAKQLQLQYAQAWGIAESEAYYQALRERLKVKITGTVKTQTAASAPSR
jgi:peptidyl-prolyl cis-trans isomerase D